VVFAIMSTTERRACDVRSHICAIGRKIAYLLIGMLLDCCLVAASIVLVGI